MSVSRRSRTVASVADLSVKQAEVVRNVGLGLSNQEIAHRMGVKLSTVKTHVRRLYTHFGVSNRIQLLRRMGVLPPDAAPVSSPSNGAQAPPSRTDEVDA